jgi:hypothetical protein
VIVIVLMIVVVIMVVIVVMLVIVMVVLAHSRDSVPAPGTQAGKCRKAQAASSGSRR